MQTLQIQEQPKEIQNENKSSLFIPKEIQDIINTRGFYIYEWIGTGDLKNSIENDFLNIVQKTGGIAGIIIIVLGYLAYELAIVGGAIYIGILLLSLLIMTIYKANLLFKNSYVILTDKGISINKQITYYENLSHIEKDINFIGNYFQEEIFKESKLKATKGALIKKITKNIKTGYEKIFDFFGNSKSKEAGQGLFIGMTVYTIYVGALVFSYFISSILFLIVGFILSIIIKQLFKLSGNKEVIINDLFDKINIFSKETESKKLELKKLLDEASNNNWQDGLLNKINAGIEEIAKNSQKAIGETNKLKSILQNKNYSQLFNHLLFNSWIRTQIVQPLIGLENLLQLNKTNIEENINKNNSQLESNIEDSLKHTLVLANERLKFTKNTIEKQIEILNAQITKLSI